MNRKTKLFGFVFDLNQTPLSSPRETVPDGGDDDDVVIEPPVLSLPKRSEAQPVVSLAGAGSGLKGEDGDNSRDADGESIRCIDCGTESRTKGTLLGEKVKQCRCFKCLFKDPGGDGVGSRSGSRTETGGGVIAFLDLNASPPREMEVEACDDVKWDRNQEKVQASSYSSVSGSPLGPFSTMSNMVLSEKGLHPLKPPNTAAAIANSGPSETSFCVVDAGSTNEGRTRVESTPADYNPKSQNELYLEVLREYIAERNGVLSDGWSVEFEFSTKTLGTVGAFYAPDGSRFESPSDVALYLGLSLNPHPHQPENVETGFNLMQNGMPFNQRIKECSWASESQQRQGILWNSSQLKSLSSAIESVNGSQVDFPIQFEDFYLLSAGVIDSRPSYCHASEIWPVGYRSVWHDKITGSLFVFDIKDGGDSGPNFIVQRYPCHVLVMPSKLTVLSRPRHDKNEGKDNLIIDEESLSTQMMLSESTPPKLDDDNSPGCVNYKSDSQQGNLLSSGSFSQKSGSLTSEILGQRDSIGKFKLEGRSQSSLWGNVCEILLRACYESFNRTGVLQLGCDHCEIYVREQQNDVSLSKFSHLAGPFATPCTIISSNEFRSTHELVAKWLQPDRFGLDTEFVQEIVEQLPGVKACSGYTLLTKRKHHSTLQTVESGFLQVKRKRANLEADALLLAEGTKKIFGSLLTENEAVTTTVSDVAAASNTMDTNTGEFPEWAQVLEPVRKLPTNAAASWMHPDFKMPTERGDLRKLSEEIAASAVPLENIKFTDQVAASYIGLSVVRRIADLDSYDVAKEMSVEESANQAGALLAQFNPHFLHLCDLAASSDSYQRHIDELKETLSASERSTATLEREFNRRSAELESLENENGRLFAEVRSLRIEVAQSDSRLKAVEDQNLENDKKLVVLGIDKDEAVERLRAQEREVQLLRSAEYKECLIADFKKSWEYESEIKARAVSFFHKGVIHVIRQLHHLVPDKKLLVNVYKNNFDAEACRKGADFVPFEEDELESLRALDEEKGLPEWTPPEPVHPTFWELLEAPMEEEVAQGEESATEVSSGPNLALIPSSSTPIDPGPGA